LLYFARMPDLLCGLNTALAVNARQACEDWFGMRAWCCKTQTVEPSPAHRLVPLHVSHSCQLSTHVIAMQNSLHYDLK